MMFDMFVITAFCMLIVIVFIFIFVGVILKDYLDERKREKLIRYGGKCLFKEGKKLNNQGKIKWS